MPVTPWHCRCTASFISPMMTLSDIRHLRHFHHFMPLQAFRRAASRADIAAASSLRRFRCLHAFDRHVFSELFALIVDFAAAAALLRSASIFSSLRHFRFSFEFHCFTMLELFQLSIAVAGLSRILRFSWKRIPLSIFAISAIFIFALSLSR